MENIAKSPAVPIENQGDKSKYYLKIGSSYELSGKDKLIYRTLEILPGFLSWSTIIGVILLSWLAPVFAAIFIITFDIYWLIKTVFLSLHLSANWKRLRKNLKTDWEKKLNEMPLSENWQEIWQMIIMPFYKEGFDVVSDSLESLLKAKWPKEKMIIVLTGEESAGEEMFEVLKQAKEKYENKFGFFLTTSHPKNIPGEIPGKGSNMHWAGKIAEKEIVIKNNLNPKKILVSAFDVDTVAYPQYFLVLTYHFLTCEFPYRSSFQPVPVFNNNIWQAPFFSRVAMTSATFWQMMQQERPERLATFSSHSVSFKTLSEIGFWQPNMVSEDSRIFWNSLLHYDSDYRVVPISYPVSMDGNVGKNFWQTAKNVYKQQRRWTWGAENVPYILFGFLKNKNFPFKKKLRFSFVQVEGFWSLATNPLIIFMLGWLPLFLGSQEFNNTLLSYNLPRITRDLMNLAMLGLISSAIISTSLLPPRPANIKKKKYISMVLQWLFIPFTIVFFGSVPGLDSQTRLMLGGKHRLGFWPTPKFRFESRTETKKETVKY